MGMKSTLNVLITTSPNGSTIKWLKNKIDANDMILLVDIIQRLKAKHTDKCITLDHSLVEAISLDAINMYHNMIDDMSNEMSKDSDSLKALIKIYRDGSITIVWVRNELDADDAILLVEMVQRSNAMQSYQDLKLDLSQIKKMSLDAISLLASMSDFIDDPEFPYVIISVDIGLENLSVDEARLLAQMPSPFLNFDYIKNLTFEVAQQFSGCGRNLSFRNCEDLSPEVLRALVDPIGANSLQIGLRNISIEQAQALSAHSGDLGFEADQISAEVRFILRKIFLSAPFNNYNVTEEPY